MQDDEIDEMVETEQIFVDEMVEMVRIDDKYQFLMIVCKNNDVLMCVVEMVVRDDMVSVLHLIDNLEILELLDEQSIML